MAKRTLLDMVQEILNDMDGDEVNSIDDTIEAQQVASIIKSTYLAMMSNRNWPHLRKSISLTPTTDLAQPTHMSVDDDIKELSFINYDCRKSVSDRSKWIAMKWKDPDDFLAMTNSYNELNDNGDVINDDSGIDISIMNDRHPTCYTSFNDRTLIFNSYDSSRESNLQETYIQSMAYVMPSWNSYDDYVPDLPDEAFTALVEEAKSKCSMKLRQMADSKADEESKRQQRWLSRKARRVNQGISYPDYGRRTRGRGRNPYIDKDN